MGQRRRFAQTKDSTGSHSGKPTENSHVAHKVAVRQWLLERMAPNPRVLDLFAGDGAMWSAAWGRTQNYVGFEFRDVPTHGRDIRQGDSNRLLTEAALDEFDILDIDAYGFPWTHYVYACRKMAGRTRPVGFALTDGAGLTLQISGMREDVRKLFGLATHKRVRFEGGSYSAKVRDRVVASMVAEGARSAGMRVADSLECRVRNRTNVVIYAALLLVPEVST